MPDNSSALMKASETTIGKTALCYWYKKQNSLNLYLYGITIKKKPVNILTNITEESDTELH